MDTFRNKLQFNSSNLAKFSFFVYIFFVIFGTSLPFQDRLAAIDEITTSNPINQFVFSILYIFSFFSLLSKKKQIIQFIKTEKFLSLFLFWSLCTVFWSDFFFVSLKRWLQIFGSVIIFLSALLNFSSLEEIQRYFRAIFIVYLPLTILSVIFIPGAIQWEFPAWRGLAPHKNYLGQIALFALIFWIFVTAVSNFRKKIFAFVFVGLSFIVYVGAQSTTCFVVGCFLLFLVTIRLFGKFLGPPEVQRFFFLMTTVAAFMIFFSVSYLAPDLLASFVELFGKDMTFTGRVDLWDWIFNISKEHLLLGCGFGGFWVMDSPHLAPLFEEFPWFPNTSHMGYLDILNETGIIGAGLLALMIIFYFKNIFKLERENVWKWFFISTLFLNIQETTLFLQNTLSGVLFIISYLALYSELFKNKKQGIKFNV